MRISDTCLDLANPRHIVAIVVFATYLFLAPSPATATTCARQISTLADDYENSDGIVIAQVRGCPEGIRTDINRCPDERYHLDVVEVLKGAVPSRDLSGTYAGGIMGCGVTLNIGQSFLLFVTAEGTLNQAAGGALKGRSPLTRTVQENVRILRDFRDKKIHDLSGSWHFSDNGLSCELRHRVKNQSLSFGYTYFDSDGFSYSLRPSWDYDGNVTYNPVRSRSPGKIEVEYNGPDAEFQEISFSAYLNNDVGTIEDSSTIEVGGRSWKLYTATYSIWISDKLLRNDSVTEVAVGDDANEILRAMLEPSDIVVRSSAAWYLGPVPPTEQSPHPTIRTRSTQIGSAAAKFLACVDGSHRRGLSGSR